MRKFETLLLLSPELAADAREALLGTFTGVIERAGGRFTADHWGMRDLAYPVRKQMRGYFVRLEYDAPATPWPNSNASSASATARSSSLP